MKNEPTVYSCSVCGQIVELVHKGGGSLVCCNKTMQRAGEKQGESQKVCKALQHQMPR